MRLGVDIDDVIADFTASVLNFAGVRPDRYKDIITYDYKPVIADFKQQVWNHVKDSEQFWLTLPPIERHIPSCCVLYLTARYCSDDVTKEWLKRNGLPLLPIVNVNHVHCGTERDVSKTEKMLEHGLDGLVDDKDKHFLDAVKVRPNSFLVSRPWNKGVVTPQRIFRLAELEWR